MFKIIYKNTRPSDNIGFFIRTPTVLKILKRYRDNGLMLKDELVFSPDNLVRTYTMWWFDRDSLLQYNSEPEIQAYVKSKNWYDAQNDMYVNIITKIVEDFDE